MAIATSERIESARRERRQTLNLNNDIAILGDAQGNIADPLLPGNVLVSIFSAGTYLDRRSVRGPDIPFPLTPGKPVRLGRDTLGNLQILAPHAGLILAGGGDPIADSEVMAAGGTTQAQNQTLRVIANGTPDLTVWIKAGNPIVNNTKYQFLGAQVDLTSSVPSAGNMCYAVVAVNNDYATTSVSASTPRDVSDIPLGPDDESEAMAGLPAGAIPIWAIKLIGGQTEITQTQIDAEGQDERQDMNINTIYNYTPSSSADTFGNVGDIAWDNTHLYWKTLANGWMRVTGSTF